MPYWLEGWIEVRPRDDQENLAWSGVLRIGPLVDVADEFSERFFGLSKRLTSLPLPDGALAAGRGVPSNASPQLHQELEEHASHEREFGPGELGGYTHASWRELAEHAVDDSKFAESDWALVFDIARRLASDARFGLEGVRIVVWYNW